MLKISNVKVKLGHHDYVNIISSLLNVSKKRISNVKLIKQAIDARNKNRICFICSFTFDIDNEDNVLNNNKKLQLSKYKPNHYPTFKPTNETIMVVGSGPAGLFCAYNLAKNHQKVILIERGMSVEQRKQDIDNFFETGVLKPNSNVQFGEGGAGTFSDGKLTSGNKDYRKDFVLETFHKFGAHDDILYLNKPHIGTDVLIDVVKNMREYIIKHGGEVHFETTLIDLVIEDQQLKKAVVQNNNETKNIKVDKLVLAIGHSARDTYKMLYDKGLSIEQKPFAVGFRIEHLQNFINVSQYGKYANHPDLKAADYKLTSNTSNNRGVYTFCMCPGGYVVNASSEEGHLVVNGMSNYKRDNTNANSAVLVTVTPNDFSSDHPLAGIDFQRELEKKAYRLGGNDYSVPVQRVEDYLENKLELEMDQVHVSVKRYNYANLNELFNNELNNSLKEGLINMNNKIHGFTSEAMLLGVESRSSAPVKFNRNENMESNIKGIYPIGEGAGWAGGIMSSAIDGLKCSQVLLGSDND